jgi:hypothetical protein
MGLAIYWPEDWPRTNSSMKRILDHVDGVVRPALRKYVTAEQSLTAAIASTDAIAIDAAHEVVKLAARQAAVELHLADFVLKEPSSSLRFADIAGVRSAVEANASFFGRAVRLPMSASCEISPMPSSITTWTGQALRSRLRLTSLRSALDSERFGGAKASLAASSSSWSPRKTATSVH